jgi:transcriptional regulator of acetoin/glycerol metabolism
MCEDKILCYRHLSSSLQVGVRNKHGEVPETLSELKSAKSHIIEESYGPVERAFLLKALEITGWNITQAAKRVGMQRSNFSSLMKKHALTLPPSAKMPAS